MKTPVIRLFLSVSALACVSIQGIAAAEADAVVSPAKRQETLGQAKELLSEKTASISGKNPFNPEGFGDVAPSPNMNPEPAGPRSEQDLLQAIATGLRPRLIVLGGQPELFFGQKRVKAGGSLTITFEGSEYILDVVSIAPPNFTLRLNREEFTRPIK